MPNQEETEENEEKETQYDYSNSSKYVIGGCFIFFIVLIIVTAYILAVKGELFSSKDEGSDKEPQEPSTPVRRSGHKIEEDIESTGTMRGLKNVEVNVQNIPNSSSKKLKSEI